MLMKKVSSNGVIPGRQAALHASFNEDCVVSAVPTGNQAGRSINLPAKNNPVGYDLVVITLINDRYVDDVSSGTRQKLPMKR